MSNNLNINKESILDSIKKLLGIFPSDTVFDVDIIFHINTVFANLAQMGVGPIDANGNNIGFKISSSENVWSEFTDDDVLMENVKTYIYIKVKLTFDPPTSSALLDAYKEQAKELEWRLYTLKGGY